MSVASPRPTSHQVLDSIAGISSKPARPPLWSPIGWTWHLGLIAALFVLVIASTANTLTSGYVLQDRSGFTLDSRYIIELDVRSRALQWNDRADMQRVLLGDIGLSAADLAMSRVRPPLQPLVQAARKSADQESVTDFGFVNYFTKDYWWPKGISGLYRPLTSITYWWNFAPIRNVPAKKWEEMYRDNPEEYRRISAQALVRFHWTNSILHWVCATLVYFVVLAVTNRYWVSAFAAAMFAVHPITVESVANIIGRADIFAAIAVFSALLLYIRSTKVHGWRRLPWLAGVMLVGTVGVFAKESALAFAPVCVVYEVLFMHRCRVEGVFESVRTWWSNLRRHEHAPAPEARLAEDSSLVSLWGFPLGRTFTDFTVWLGDFIGACIRFAVRGWVWLIPPVIAVFYVRHLVFAASTPPEEPFLDNPIRGDPLVGLHPNPALNFIMQRVTALKVVANLLLKLIFPVNLCADYSFNQIPTFDLGMKTIHDWWAVLAVLIVLAFIVLGFVLWARGAIAASFMIFFYACAMLPTANIVKIIGAIQAERFMYLPLLGFVGGLSLLTFWAAGRFIKDQSGPLRFVPHAALSVLIVLYGIRTFDRNWDWRSDEKLWESAQGICPNAFRVYQSYAFALYENAQIDNLRVEQRVRQLEKDRDEAQKTLNDSASNSAQRAEAQLKLKRVTEELPAAEKARKELPESYRARLQKMIDVDEAGLKIVDVLPPQRNSARLYLHLGMYYAEMGKTYLIDLPPNAPLPREARDWYQKSVDILKRAIPIDRSFSELNRRKEIMRGKKLWEIGDAGLAPVYMFLAESQLRLNQVEDAVESYKYVQRLDPVTPISYMQIGMIRLSQGKVNDALIALLQAVILDPSRDEPWPVLQQIYQGLNQKDAIIWNPPQRQVNAAIPLVQQHVRDAMRELVRAQLRGKQLELARTLRKQAIDVHKAPAALFDSLFEESGVPIEPPAEKK